MTGPRFVPTGSISIGMTDTDELVGWLRAQLADDERVARAATDGPWHVATVENGLATIDGPEAKQRGGYDERTGDYREVVRPLVIVPPDCDFGPSVEEADAAHIAHWDPPRVLAEVDAKRRIIDECVHEAARSAPKSNLNDMAWIVLRSMTAPYADRPGYRDEWRP